MHFILSRLRQHRFSRGLLLAVLAFSAGIICISSPAISSAVELRHLRLKASFPARDTTLAGAPEAIQLWFSEPAEASTARIGVKDSKGAVVPMSKVVRGDGKDEPLTSRFVSAPANGRYSVEWRAMSNDGHVVNGSFNFSVQVPK